MAIMRWLTVAAMCATTSAITFMSARALRHASASNVERVTAISELASVEQGGEIAELVLVYVGDAHCLFSTRPELRPAVRAVIDSLRARVHDTGVILTTVGVDIDPVLGQEMEHLRSIAVFNQVAVGVGLGIPGLNTPLGSAPLGGQAPQMFLYSRTIRKRSGRGEPLVGEMKADTLIVRKVGLREILNWADSGVQTPPIPKRPPGGELP